MINLVRLSTKSKILIARILYKIVTVFVGKGKRTIQRQKINYEVDLSEGIELSLYLFGSFQQQIINSKFLQLKPDDIIIDIGANVGLMSLQYAARVPQGRVYSFEPTSYAFEKLNKNLSLNPDLASRVIATQAFISEKSGNNDSSLVAYCSWKVDGTRNAKNHLVHQGSPKETTGVLVLSIDDFVDKNHLTKINLIKIDTDGFEYEVLKGARKAIKQFLPTIIFEISLYSLQEKGITFDFYSDYFTDLGYSLFDLLTKREVNQTNYKHFIPENGSTDLIAVPLSFHQNNGTKQPQIPVER